MKTFLFCTAFLNKEITSHNKQRYLLWLYYYMPKLKKLGVDHVFLINDGKDNIDLAEDIGILSAENLPPTLEYEVNIVYFRDHLGRNNVIDFPGWWRSFTFASIIAREYHFTKIIHIESDFYVLSNELFSFIKNTTDGWLSLFSHHFNFPETAIQIINKDYLPYLDEIYDKAIDKNFTFNNFAELLLPFSSVEKVFIGDRLGEQAVLYAWLANNNKRVLDYIGQISSVAHINSLKRYFEFSFEI